MYARVKRYRFDRGLASMWVRLLLPVSLAVVFTFTSAAAGSLQGEVRVGRARLWFDREADWQSCCCSPTGHGDFFAVTAQIQYAECRRPDMTGSIGLTFLYHEDSDFEGQCSMRAFFLGPVFALKGPALKIADSGPLSAFHPLGSVALVAVDVDDYDYYRALNSDLGFAVLFEFGVETKFNNRLGFSASYVTDESHDIYGWMFEIVVYGKMGSSPDDEGKDVTHEQ